MTSKLKQIQDLCKCGVFVTINEHRDYYEPAEEYLNERSDWFDNIDDGIKAKMIELDTIVSVQAYNRTPVGFYVVHHYDLNAALSDMLETLKND